MPKRICPFEYDLLPQNKVHVSEKEVCDEESVKSLYDKTLKMLFVGARKVPNVTESRVAARIHLGCPVVKHKQHFSSPNMKHNYKQMFLDSQCQLQSLGTIKNQDFIVRTANCHARRFNPGVRSVTSSFVHIAL